MFNAWCIAKLNLDIKRKQDKSAKELQYELIANDHDMFNRDSIKKAFEIECKQRHASYKKRFETDKKIQHAIKIIQKK